MPHPEEEQLLRYSDGELPGRTMVRVRSHLEACWQCRTNLEELEKTVGACVRYRTTVLQKHLPDPPAPWMDIYVRFAQIDATLDQPTWTDRLGQMLAWPLHNVKKWAPVGVALMIVWVLVYRYRLTPSVQAAELLHRAILAADTHPAKPHKIQIRTKAHRVTRLAGSEQAMASNVSDRETLNSLKTLFHQANYNWDDPLNARSYSSWRNQLATKQDRVTEDRDSYRIQTNTESGDLMEATLQLRSRDLEPMEGRFEFRNREWVEITTVPEEVEPSTSAVAGNGTVPEMHSRPIEATPNGVPPTAPALPATAGDELHVLAALHQVGADLGDPVEVSRSVGEILVSGVGIPTQRQEEIQQAVRSLPHVVVRFAESEPAGPPTQPAAPDNTASPDIRLLQARIAEQMGGRAHFEQLAAQVLDMSEPLMARAYALRRLVDRFPVQVEAQLGSRDLETLRQLQREHTAALRQQTMELEQALKPVLSSAGGPARGAPPAALSADAWQPATEDLFQSARRVEKLLAVMFGASPSDSAEEQLPGQLQSSLAQLRAKVEAYDRLLVRTER